MPPRIADRSRRRPLALAAALLLLAPACGSEGPRLPVHPAGGQVLYKGQPAAGAVVRLHPVDPATIKAPEGGPPVGNPTATADAEGRFSLSTYLADDGVPAGRYRVTVLLDEPGEEDAPDAGNQEAPPARRKGPPRGARYRDPAATPLEADVTAGGENRFVFELE